MEIPHQEKQKERKINPEILRRSELSTSLIVKPAAILLTKPFKRTNWIQLKRAPKEGLD